MKKTVVLFTTAVFLCVQLGGCASYNRQFTNKADMGLFSGCISGMIAGGIALNLPGAGAGCMLGMGLGFFIGERMDKKMWSRQEALMKHPLKENEEKLVVEEHSVDPQSAPAKAKIQSSVQYTVLSADERKEILITEKRMLFSEKTGVMQLDERQVLRTQGTYKSTYRFVVPENIPKGDCIIITTISDEKETKMVQSHFTAV